MDVSGALSSRRRRLWACGSLLIVGAGVVAYRSYSGKEPVAGWSYLTRVRKALRKYSEAFLMGSEISSLLLRDLQAFLASDAQDLPQSLKQLLRLAESEVVQRTTSQIVTAAMKGVMEASQSSSSSSGNFLEKLIAAFSSNKGSNLLTLAISVACRSSISAWCEHQARQDAAASEAGRPDSLQRLLNWAGTREGQQLTQRSITAFVHGGTEVYMDKLEGTNSWADMLEAISRPGNGAVADRITRVFVREMVTSYFRRSPEDDSGSSSSSSAHMEDITHLHSSQQSKEQSNRCAVDGLYQVSSMPQQPNSLSSLAQNGEASVSSICKAAVLPVLADATASSVPLADVPFQGSVALAQMQSKQGRSKVKQHDSSNQWAKEVIEVARVPEARKVLVILAATASAQGVRGAFLALKDLLLGENSSTWQLDNGLRMPMQRLYVLVGVMFLIILFFATRHRPDFEAVCV